MKKEELIKQLQKLPAGQEVCIFDWRKALRNIDGGGEPNGIGVEPEFEVKFVTEDDGWYNPLIVLAFKNDDYKDDGSPDYGASIMQSHPDS